MKQILIFLLMAACLMGCEASIGDKCKTSNDCPAGTVCDTDSPGGYCLVANCDADEECPEEAACVKFTESQRYCLKKCKKNSDCRSGDYTCREDIGDQKFCYIRADYVYGRDESNEIPYESPSE